MTKLMLWATLGAVVFVVPASLASSIFEIPLIMLSTPAACVGVFFGMLIGGKRSRRRGRQVNVDSN